MAAALKPRFYRAMNAISPFYYQGLNFIRVDRVNKTTGKLDTSGTHDNITSLAMTLEGAGEVGGRLQVQSADPAHRAGVPEGREGAGGGGRTRRWAPN